MKTIDFTGDNGIATNFKIASQANLIFASLGERGCMVVNGKNYTVVYEYKSNQFLSAIGVTSDAKYVFLSQNNSLAMFEFVDKKEFVFQSSASFNNCVILDIIVSSNNKFAFIAGEKGILAVYNIADPSKIFKVAELQTVATLINRINFSKDEKFLFVGNNELGFTLIKLNFNQLNNQEISVTLKLVGNALPYWKIFQCIPTQDLKYVYCTDYWYGVYIATLDDIISQPESNYPIQIRFKLRSWPLNSISPLVFSIELFNEDQYLLVSVRSLGIFIFDIKDRENLILYQKIYVSGQPVQLSISPIDGNIVYANKIQLNIFKQTMPNLNNINPNLFNSHQSMIVQYYPQVFYNWRCYLSDDNQYYYGTQDYMGLVIAYIPDNNPYKIQFKQLIPAIPPNFTEDTTVTKNKKYIFQAVQENGCTLKIHDISDLSNINIIQCLTIYEPTQHAEQQAISDDETILVLSYDNGILIIDVSLPAQAKILSYWKMEGLMIGNLAGVMITKDKKWVLGTARGYGVCALNIQDPTNPLYTDSINTQGGEGIIASPYNQNVAYLLDGYRGVAVIDLSQLPKLKILSRVQLRGWTNDLTVFTNDQFLLVSTMDDGQLTLVNSSDPNNLFIISMFQHGQESSQSSCFTSDFQYAFINNEFGTRIMPLKSQINLHTQISQFIVSENNQVSSQLSLNQEDILQVGQNIKFDFIPIYQKEEMVISKIFYYDQSTLEIQELPSWINVYNNNFSLKFQVPKESLRSNVSEPVQNTILIKSALQLNASNFIYNQDGFQTNQTLASQIFQILKDKLFFLDENGIVTDRFFYDSNITLTDLQFQDLNLLEFINKQVKMTLQFAVFYNPVIFMTQNSLLFDLANNKQMIKTPSQNLKIAISFLNNQGSNCVFVNIPYSGCIQELSSDQSTIQLSGSTININNALFNQVIYHCKKYDNDDDNNSIKIGVQIIDNLNYDYNDQFNIIESVFLKQLKNISINTQMHSLQKQFENQYYNSEIPIETDVNFSFDNSYFVQPQSNFLPITYSLFYYDGSKDNYTLANSNYWIKLEASQLKFYGFASSNMFQTVQKLKIVASNGYDEYYDYLYISISLVSFLYALNIILKIFGIIVGFFGFYKFKSFIYNKLINDKVLYSDETAIINHPFFKQITIIGDDFEIAKLLFNQFKLKFFKGKIQFVIRPCREQIKTTQESQNSYPNQDAIKQSQLSNFNNNNNNNNSFSNNLRQQQQNMQNSLFSLHQNKQEQINNSFSIAKTLSNQGNQNSIQNINQQKNKKFQKKTKKIFQNLQHNISKESYNDNESCQERIKKLKQFQNRYICEQKKIIKIDLLLHDMKFNKISIIFQKREYSINSLKPILDNKNSVFYNCMKSIVCRYLISQDNKTLKLYKYLKEYAKVYSKFTPNDWYKYYFDITYYASSSFNKIPSITNLNIQENQIQVGDNNNNNHHMPQYNKNQIQEAEEDDIFKNPLPILKIREKLICQILYQNGFIQDSKKGIDQIIEKDINPYLLKNVLLSDAMGLQSLKMKSLLPSLGESIHCFPHQVKIIQASYLIPSQNYCFQRKNYKNYQPFSLETKLPKWLSVKCIKNALVFYGTPKLSDEKVILVKIINQSNIIIRKFRICLLEEINYSFTKLDKVKKKTLVLPVYANYFHEIQKSLKEIDSEYEDKTQNNLSEKSSEVDPQQVQNAPNNIRFQNLQRNFYSEQKIQNEIEENNIKFKQLAQSFFLTSDPDQKIEQQNIEKQTNQKLPTKQFLEFIQTEILQASQAIDPIHSFQPKVLELNNSGFIKDSSKLAFKQNSQTNQQNLNFTDYIPSEKQLPSFNF
ncbi:hypothetical protein ABPG72_017886 [Tetrahymena utriculariae]